MSEARDLYSAAFQAFAPGNEAAFEQFNRAADLWRNAGQDFSAGMAMSAAVMMAWGRPDRMAEAQNASLRDFQSSVVNNARASPGFLASL